MDEAHRLRIIDKMVLRKVFGPNKEELREGWKKFHNDELRALKSSLIIQAIKQGGLDGQGIWYVHKRRNSYRILVGSPAEFISYLPTTRPDVHFSDKVHLLMRDRRTKYFSSYSQYHCSVWLIVRSVPQLHRPVERFTFASRDIHQKKCFSHY